MDKERAEKIIVLVNQLSEIQRQFTELTGQQINISQNVVQVAAFAQGFLTALTPKPTPIVPEVVEPTKE